MDWTDVISCYYGYNRADEPRFADFVNKPVTDGSINQALTYINNNPGKYFKNEVVNVDEA